LFVLQEDDHFMAKTLAEIQEGLARKYSGLIKKIDGFDYIPWPDAVRAANELFDPDGYDIENLRVWREDMPNAAGQTSSGYATVVRVTVHPADSRPFFRDGLGFSEVVFTQEKEYTDRKTGDVKVIPARALIDSAIKGCVSRALLRALVLLGESFGLFLYDKEDQQASTGASSSGGNGAYQQRSQGNGNSGGGGDRRPSENQVPYLLKAGLTQKEVETAPFTVWKAVIDAHFAKDYEERARLLATYRASTPPADEEEGEGEETHRYPWKKTSY
jgi:hypothetical protein